MEYTYKYPRPMVTVDMIVTTPDFKKLLLIKRKNEPYRDCWAFPGGYIEMDETLEESALRELKEETSLTDVKLKKIDVYGDPGRDTRGRTITIIYYGVCSDLNNAIAADDAKELKWFDINNLPELAFDHGKIFSECLSKILRMQS